MGEAHTIGRIFLPGDRIKNDAKMTFITAKVINIAKVGEQYFVAVQVGHNNYSGTFEGLNLERTSRKPDSGPVFDPLRSGCW
jgi:hypothetical protein